jgi:TatD DNase family protein
MILTDTHTHLYSKEFDTERKDLIKNAIDKGISRFFLPNIDTDSLGIMLHLCNEYPQNCFPMIGLHPCSVNEKYQQELNVVKHWLEKENSSGKKFYAVGEIGIDLYWDKTFINQQQDAFERQINLAAKYNLPIVIHTRNSFDEVYKIVYDYKHVVSGIFHCFSGTQEQAEKIIALGNFKLGVGGVLTFKNSGLDKVMKEIDMKHIVLETDAPYLAPAPYRGKTNLPEYLLFVAQKLAEIKNISIEEVAEITTKNSKEIFGI